MAPLVDLPSTLQRFAEMSLRKVWLCALFLALAASGVARAQGGACADSPLARRWDHVNFEIHDRAEALAEADGLEKQAEEAVKAAPNQPCPLVWQGMALLAKADAKRDFGALPMADRAHRLLEKAIDLGLTGEDAGFVSAVVGTLYADMPGFPLGFGNRNRAKAWFAKALAAAPDDIDVNVLYGDFLLKQHDYAGAIAAAKKALNAPPRPGREIRDKYRRDEATKLLAQAEQKASGGSSGRPRR